MEQFVAAVFADRDVVSHCGPLQSSAVEWMVWLRPSPAIDSMHLSVYVRRKDKDQTEYTALELAVTTDLLQTHMNDLGVTSDLSSFALPFKTALSSARNLTVEVEDNGTVLVEVTYVFGPSLTRKGLFTLPPSLGASVPRHVVDLLQSLRTMIHETSEEQTSRRARRSTLLLSTAATPIQLATASSPPPTTAAKRKPVLPLGARRKVARGAKFADDDDDE